MKRADVVIGASEAAAALGMDAFKTPVDLFSRKLGLAEDTTSLAAWVGTHVEHAIATMFEDEHGMKVDNLASIFSEIKSGDNDGPGWRLRATLDRVIPYDSMTHDFRRAWDVVDGEWLVLECKTAGLVSERPAFMLRDEWGPARSDAIPKGYAVQAMIQARNLNEMLEQMGAGFCSRTIVKALIGGRPEVPDFIVTAAPDAVRAIVDRLSAFVENHLVPESPPFPVDADDWKQWSEVVRRPRRRDVLLPADEIKATLMKQYKMADDVHKASALALASVKAQIIQQIGDAAGIEADFGRATFTSGTLHPQLKPTFAKAAIELATKRAGDPLADTILDLVREHTKSVHTGRTLRVNFNKESSNERK